MKPNLEIIESKLFNGVVADEIVASIRDSISENDRCSIALAGGSTPSSIYRLLARPPRIGDVEWDKLDIYWGDERWVALDHTQNNYRMTSETLLSQIVDAHPRIYPVNTALASPQDGARDYSRIIREREGEQPSLDIVLLGVGEDGHTASIFPGSSIIDDCNELCVAVEHPEGGYRVTMSPKLLFSAKKVFFIVKGESKADMMVKVLEGNTSPKEIPARLLEQAQGSVTFFLDSGAAHKLSGKLTE